MAVAESSALLSPPSRVHGWFRRLSLATVVSSFALVVLGGVVRVTDSGLGCPDWPLCHGGILPPWQLEAVIEYSHRLVASAIVGPLVLATGVLVWFAYRREPWLVAPATLAVVLLLGQAMLGGATVLGELSPGLVAAHLALGEALLACLILVLIVAYRGPLTLRTSGGGEGITDRFPMLALVSAVAVYVLILSGSYVTASGASAACSTDWPLCQGSVLPEARLPVIHMAHRFAAVLIGGFLMYTLHLGCRGRHRTADVRYLSMAAAALFLAQVAVGAFTVWLRFPQALNALHLAMATAVWSATAALAVLVFAQQGVSGKEAVHA